MPGIKLDQSGEVSLGGGGQKIFVQCPLDEALLKKGLPEFNIDCGWSRLGYSWLP